MAIGGHRKVLDTGTDGNQFNGIGALRLPALDAMDRSAFLHIALFSIQSGDERLHSLISEELAGCVALCCFAISHCGLVQVVERVPTMRVQTDGDSIKCYKLAHLCSLICGLGKRYSILLGKIEKSEGIVCTSSYITGLPPRDAGLRYASASGYFRLRKSNWVRPELLDKCCNLAHATEFIRIRIAMQSQFELFVLA